MPTSVPPIRIGERELRITRAIARYRFLSARQISQIDGGSEQHLSRRLKLLVEHKYLALPKSQYEPVIVTQPRIFALARNGAKLLAEIDGLDLDHLDWATKNARATSLYIAHTIETADIMLAFSHAGAQAGLTLVDHADLLPYFPEPTLNSPHPFALKTTLALKRGPTELSLVPDRIFSLLTPTYDRYNFALEYDRGTMPVKRRTLVGKSSFARKLVIYWNAWCAKQHQQQWGFQQFRVLTVTPSEQRLQAMAIAANRIAGRATGLFLFTTPERLRTSGPLANIWTTLKGERVALLDMAR